jgi:alanine dehydrogenase
MRDERRVVLTPRAVTESMVKKMRPGSVILDLAIDHGGCVESITSYRD